MLATHPAIAKSPKLNTQLSCDWLTRAMSIFLTFSSGIDVAIIPHLDTILLFVKPLVDFVLYNGLHRENPEPNYQRQYPDQYQWCKWPDADNGSVQNFSPTAHSVLLMCLFIRNRCLKMIQPDPIRIGIRCPASRQPGFAFGHFYGSSFRFDCTPGLPCHKNLRRANLPLCVP